LKNNKVNKTTATLIIYTLVYYIITYYFIIDIQLDRTKTIEYMTIFPMFWIVALVILFSLVWILKLKIRTWVDKVLLVIASPLPVLIWIMI